MDMRFSIPASARRAGAVLTGPREDFLERVCFTDVTRAQRRAAGAAPDWSQPEPARRVRVGARTIYDFGSPHKKTLEDIKSAPEETGIVFNLVKTNIKMKQPLHEALKSLENPPLSCGGSQAPSASPHEMRKVELRTSSFNSNTAPML
jgi:hypothetical protein